VDVVTRASLAALAVLVALAACRIADLDYEGKDCPCPDGWQCNLVTDTCTRAAPADGNQNPDSGSAPGDANNAGDSCFPNPRTTLLYASVGFTDFPQGWLFQSSGQWSSDGSQVTQTNSANKLAWMSHAVTTTGGASNYRVVATMRYIGSTAGGSVGIGFRISGATMYTCTFDPVSGAFDMIYTQQGIDAPMQRKLLEPLTNATDKFTLEIMTSGNTHMCCLRDADNSTLMMPASFIASGNPGVVTRDSEGSFSSIYVYE
jgi:hypothetical protein